MKKPLFTLMMVAILLVWVIPAISQTVEGMKADIKEDIRDRREDVRDWREDDRDRKEEIRDRKTAGRKGRQ